jgi:hypothetical protein
MNKLKSNSITTNIHGLTSPNSPHGLITTKQHPSKFTEPVPIHPLICRELSLPVGFTMARNQPIPPSHQQTRSTGHRTISNSDHHGSSTIKPPPCPQARANSCKLLQITSSRPQSTTRALNTTVPSPSDAVVLQTKQRRSCCSLGVAAPPSHHHRRSCKEGEKKNEIKPG